MLASEYFSIDKSSSLPIYYLIQQNLVELIDLGLLKADDSLPSERDLSQYYGVTRMTVRQAIDTLVQKGLVYKQHGVGTFISEQKPVKDFVPTVMGFSSRMREAGLSPSSQLIDRTVITPTPLIAHRLQIPQQSQVIALKRLRMVNDEALMVETSYLPYEQYPAVMTADLAGQSLYKFLEEQYQVSVDEAEQTLEPTLMSDGEAALFGMEAAQPAMLVRVLAFSAERRPIEFSKSVVRGDRCRYYFRVTTQKPIIS